MILITLKAEELKEGNHPIFMSKFVIKQYQHFLEIFQVLLSELQLTMYLPGMTQINLPQSRPLQIPGLYPPSSTTSLSGSQIMGDTVHLIYYVPWLVKAALGPYVQQHTMMEQLCTLDRKLCLSLFISFHLHSKNSQQYRSTVNPH